MCCGNPSTPAVSASGKRMEKMPDGTTVEVTSTADFRAKRDAVWAQMRQKAIKTGWTAEQS